MLKDMRDASSGYQSDVATCSYYVCTRNNDDCKLPRCGVYVTDDVRSSVSLSIPSSDIGRLPQPGRGQQISSIAAGAAHRQLQVLELRLRG